MFVSLETAIKFVNFGALTAFLFVNVSVIFHYIIREKRRTPTDLPRLLCPLLGAGFVFYLITPLDLSSLMLGSGWLVIGLVYYSIKRVKSVQHEVPIPEAESAV